MARGMVRKSRRKAEHRGLALLWAGFFSGVLLPVCLAAAAQAGQPVAGTIPTSGITGQKPQSKLWYGQGTWWAALPRQRGVYLWRFSDGRFHPQDGPAPLKATTHDSECDVVLAGKTLFVLAFQPKATQSTLHALQYTDGAYRPLPDYPVSLKHDAKVETIACDVDSKGMLWAAWVNDRLEVVATSFNSQDVAAGFSPPVILGEGVGRDDIAALTAFNGHVGVMWSNSKQQKFVFRAHQDGWPPDRWDAEEVPASGKGVVNDHINLAADADGNLWAVTKAATGRGRSAVQLTLRRRSAAGRWDKAFPLLPEGLTRTRPIVALDAEKPLAYVMCSDKAKVSTIYLRKVSLTDGKVGQEIKALAATHALNNVTDTKGMVSERTGLMVLAGPARAKAGPALFRLFPLKDLR